MPAYRSAAEAEVRDAVVARLRAVRPGARIIHEIQCACHGPVRIDVLAVDRAEIIAVEVKSARDKLDRLAAQVAAMRGMAHHVIAALHEKHLVPDPYRGAPPGLIGAPREANGAVVWAYPEAGSERGRTYGCAAWGDLRPAVMQCLPQGALDMLWASELRALCADLGIAATHRSTRPLMMAALRWRVTGGSLTRGICATLRRRNCPEADPICEDAA